MKRPPLSWTQDLPIAPPEHQRHGQAPLGTIRKAWTSGNWSTKRSLANALNIGTAELRALVESDGADETPVTW